MALTRVTKTGTISIDGQLTVTGSEKTFNVDAEGKVVGFPAEGSSLGYGTIKQYNTTNLYPAINSSSNGWYILTNGSLDDGSYTFHIKTGAHNSVIFTVGTGYAASAKENLQILSHTSNTNSNYLNIIGVRVTNGGGVEIRLDAGNPTSFSMTVYATGGEASNNIPLVDTLEKQISSVTVRDEVYPLVHATSRVNKLQITSQPSFNANGTGNTSTGDAVYPTVRHNIGNHYNASTGKFTAPVAGMYMFGWSSIAATTSGVYRFYFRVNNSTIGDIHLRIDNPSGNIYAQNSTHVLPWYLNANDVVHINVNEQAVTPRYGSTADDYSRFWGHLLG